MKDVVTIGDAMITFNPDTKGPMRFVSSFQRKVGGAELNVAIGCARLGLQTGWISRLGNDEFGRHILHFVRGEGIDTSQVKLVNGYPTSLYFKEIMEDGSGRSFYYRDNSPTLTMNVENFPFEYLDTTNVLHVSGVFPAIGGENYNIILKAVQYAREQGKIVSFDPNIRLKLWRSRDEMKEKLKRLLSYTDILLMGEEEGKLLFDTGNTDELYEKLKNYSIEWITITQGDRGATCYYKGEKYVGRPVKPAKVVDTVGAGDGFSAGFIYGVLQDWDIERILSFANTIGSMVVSVSGDNEGLPLLDEVMMRLGEKERIER
ncbi:MAG: sugar kinase [Bacillaceae bacterium]|nr:sugar kinase [Bacillaceae bacterium]